MNRDEKEKPEEEKMVINFLFRKYVNVIQKFLFFQTRSARSIVITTADSEYGPDVNTAIQVDAESAETAQEDGKSTRPRSVVITTGDSEYGPEVNTAIQVDVESANTAQEDGKSTTAPVDVEQAQGAKTAREDGKSTTAEVDVGQTQEDDGEIEEGEDTETVTPVETETLPELVGSQAVLKRCGFSSVGRRHDPEDGEILMYAISR